MAEENKALKELINRKVVEGIAGRLQGAGDGFDAEGFVRDACKGLSKLELKDRIRHVAGALRKHLDEDYAKAVEQIVGTLGPETSDREAIGVSIEYWPICQFVEEYGAEYPAASIPAVYELTKRFSCEFAIRPLLAKHPEKTMKAVRKWVKDPSPQVRRLCSEGTRPRLPWGMRLHQFIEDPRQTRFILDKLVDDESETVRRSVANHLNDISKDHPDVAVEIAAAWLRKPTTEREKAVKHALRTLIKKGDQQVMALYGYGKPEAKVTVAVKPARLKIGDAAKIELEIQSTAKREQKLLIDYIVHYRKASGKLSPKVFKWTEKVVPAGASIRLVKQQLFRDVSTRKHYAGEQVVEVQVNGQVLAEKKIQLEA
jgi:3-methyladenine DNA glycosylase AlkC